MIRNAFTWNYKLDQPLQIIQPPYTPKQITPCTTGKQAAKVTALAPVQTFKTVNESWNMPVAGVSIA